MRAFLKHPTSGKYCEIETIGPEQLIRTCKLDLHWDRASNYTCTFRAFANAARALADSERLKSSRLAKGYLEFSPRFAIDALPTLLSVQLMATNDVFTIRAMVRAGVKIEEAQMASFATYGCRDVLDDLRAHGIALTGAVLRGAALGGRDDTVVLALDDGVNPDEPDSHGETALMKAAQKGHPHTVQLLLDRGADPGAKNRDGIQALGFAAASGATEVIDRLLAKGADLDARDAKGRTALAMALHWSRSKKGTAKLRAAQMETCRHLLEKGSAVHDTLRASLAAIGLTTPGPDTAAPPRDEGYRADTSAPGR